jgi:putative membrane protein
VEIKDIEIEPDYRFTLANERTFLAWQRTSLGLLAAAVAVVQFMPEVSVPGLRQLLGLAVGALAVLTAVAGLHRWVQVDRAMRCDKPLPRAAAATYLTAGLVMMGVVTIGLAITATAR